MIKKRKIAKKKSIRKIPKFIISKIKKSKKPEFVAATVVHFSKSEIMSGKLRKFGIGYKNNKLIIEGKFVPRTSTGNYSKTNKTGEVVIRKDLPKITKTFSFEAPNYGDWSKGSHEIQYEREVYQRNFVKPKNLSIFPELITDKNEEVVIGFKISKTLSKSDKSFYDKLLFHLNLLQENFGKCDVYFVGEPLKEREVYKRLKWEVLPPGWWSDKTQVQRIEERLGTSKTQLFVERLKYVESLNPLERYIGESYLGNRLYYVFVFKNYVLAECPMFGNAVYLLNEDKMNSWKEIFALIKKEALKKGAVRILHLGNWKKRLAKLLS